MVAKWTPSIRFAHPRRLRPPPERPGARGIGPGGQNSTFVYLLSPKINGFSKKVQFLRRKKPPGARPPQATVLGGPGLNPKKCASAAGNSKSQNLTKNGREMGRHPSVLRIPGATKNLEAARSSWDRSRGSELNFSFVAEINFLFF